jgi:hypothetical protein
VSPTPPHPTAPSTPASAAPSVALVTAAVAEGQDDDLAVLHDAVSAAGAATAVVHWDDPTVDWSTFDVVVLRSPWDYVARHDEFLAWLARVDAVTQLHNPLPVVRWNTDKHYLVDLAAAGIPTVQTRVLEPGDDEPGVDATGDALVAAADAGGGRLVIKPTVSAGSKDTVLHTSVDAAAAHAATLLAAGRAVLVQPYLHAVDEQGETGLVYFDGVFSHAFRKGPILRPDAAPTDALFATEDITARRPTDADLAVADAVSAFAADVAGGGPLLYTRIDLLPGPDGAPVVLEVEAAEPSFFFATAPDAVDRFAAAIMSRARAASDRAT